MDKSFMHQSLHALHCPQCGHLHTDSKIGVLQETESNILATITCTKCQHQSIVTLSLGSQNTANSTMSDLRINEIPIFADQDPISSDDLLDIHQYLKKTKGDFYQDFKDAINRPTTSNSASSKKTRRQNRSRQDDSK